MFLTLLCLLVFPPMLFGQGNFIQKDNYYWYEKGCDTIYQQQPMNVCLIEAEKQLSKLVQQKYDCIISYLNVQIASKTDKEEVKYLKRERESVAQSQKTWEKLEGENEAYYVGGGGTMTPMEEALSLIDDDKDRLRRLDDIIEDLGQGNDGLKCN